MSRSDPTYAGAVQSVSGGIVSIQLRDDLTSTLVMVKGESHRLGQIGSFLRVPLGYSSLFGVVTQVGAAAAPANTSQLIPDAHRWVSLTLFGEAVSGVFERGVSQYPTVGDEIHIVTTDDLEVVYNSLRRQSTIEIGSLSSSSGIPGTLDLNRLVSRHVAVVGSTGSGKSNLVAVLLEAIATQGFPSARVVVIDAHGEYASAVGDNGYVFRVNPTAVNERPLVVPYWALPADEFTALTMGKLNQTADAAVRDAIVDLRREATTHLVSRPPDETVAADSPIPFSARRLWFELDDYERMTLQDRAPVRAANRTSNGDAASLRPNMYPAPNPGNSAPFVGPRRGITRSLELMRSRLVDARYQFLFSPGPDLTPDLAGKVQRDLDTVVADWVGHDRPITVLDISGLPPDAMSAVAGTVLRIVYDTLFWAGNLPVGGRNQPLLVVLEEAHRILPAGVDTPALRVTAQIAKEGRKFGVGLMVVTQRPSEIDQSILSQCGSMIALRTTNEADRGIVSGVMPDDLGNLSALLPALRTGEGLVVGEAMPIPSRIRFRIASNKPVGDDPNVASAWRATQRPDPTHYGAALSNWRRQSK